MTGNWKKSFNKTPAEILAAIEGLEEDEFVIFGIRTIDHGDIAGGDFAHLGIDFDESGEVEVPERWLPEPEAGPWARRNRVEGWEKKFKDLPMVWRTWSVETPNFGDWSKGSHSHEFSKEVYQKRSFAAPGWTIAMTVLEHSADTITVGFELDVVFDRTDLDELEFFFALNVFQESVGVSNVRGSTSPLADYRRTLFVNWEILPPGNAEELIREVERRLDPSEDERAIIAERLRVLAALNPTNFITGTSGFARYVGAQFDADVVVFENIRYGNAAYVMFEDWQRLSRLSRLELLASDEDFQRVIHVAGWERKLRDIVRAAVRRRRRPPR